MGIKRVKLTERQLKEKTGSRKMANAKSKKDLKDFEKRMALKKRKKLSQKDFKRIMEEKSKGPSMKSLFGDMLE